MPLPPRLPPPPSPFTDFKLVATMTFQGWGWTFCFNLCQWSVELGALSPGFVCVCVCVGGEGKGGVEQ